MKSNNTLQPTLVPRAAERRRYAQERRPLSHGSNSLREIAKRKGHVEL